MADPGIDRRLALFVKGTEKKLRAAKHRTFVPVSIAFVLPLLLLHWNGLRPGLWGLLLGALFAWAIYMLSQRLARPRMGRLYAGFAEDFQKDFAAPVPGYDYALRRLLYTQGRAPVVQGMIEHLPGAEKIAAETGGGLVWYDKVKAAPAQEPKPQASPAEAPAAHGPTHGKAQAASLARLKSGASRRPAYIPLDPMEPAATADET